VDENRFACNVSDLVFGKPEHAALGIEHYMCVEESEMHRRLGGDELQAMVEEVEANGTETDVYWLDYVLRQEAGSIATAYHCNARPDCDDNGDLHPSRRRADGTPMRLADFVEHPYARTARLNQADVLAQRLYTTPAFQTINNNMRDQERFREGRPHPLPITVLLIKRALGKMRAVGAAEGANDCVVLYRGMRTLRVQDTFLDVGGTELAPMSTTSSLKVAMMYSVSENSLLLRLKTTNFMNRGPDVSWLSAFPGELEFLFPPLTYVQPVDEPQKLRVDDVTYTVVDVLPTFP